MSFQHEVVDHAVEYVRGEVHTNGLENFWSLFKRGLNGTYVPLNRFISSDTSMSRHTDTTIEKA
jgi:ISXO2-like transposase domain